MLISSELPFFRYVLFNQHGRVRLRQETAGHPDDGAAPAGVQLVAAGGAEEVGERQTAAAAAAELSAGRHEHQPRDPKHDESRDPEHDESEHTGTAAASEEPTSSIRLQSDRNS